MTSNKNVGKSKWKRAKPFLIAIWSVLNPITIFIIIIIYIIIDGAYVGRVSSQIKKELDPLCQGSQCAYYDNERSSIWLPAVSKDFSLDSLFFYQMQSYSCDDFLLYGDNYYFLVFRKLDNGVKEYFIGSTNIYLEDFRIITSLGTSASRSNVRFSSGYDNIGYFLVNHQYYTFDYSNHLLKNVDENSKEANIATLFNDDYMKAFNVQKGELKKDSDCFLYSYFEVDYEFDSYIVDEKVFSLINKYKFKPYYHVSYPSGLTSFVFYANSGPIGLSDCLIIHYNRSINEILGYQAFHRVAKSFHLYPKLNF